MKIASRPLLATVFYLLLPACADTRPQTDAFDFNHVEGALRYYAHPGQENLEAIASTDAARHLERHSRMTGAADATALDITKKLVLTDSPPAPALLTETEALLRYAKESPDKQAACLEEAARYLPMESGWRAPLYATWGYDIGVATELGGSLNFTHEHFRKTPSEIWYYCTHEAHHVGVMQLHPFPDFGDVKTVGALIDAIEYLTFLEGTAVFAAYDMRAKEGALDDDEDYVALKDPERMQAISSRYEELMAALHARAPTDALADEDWAMLGEFSGGERLWYRHGAAMAQKIYAAQGLSGFRTVISQGPKAFFSAAESSE